MMSWWLMVVKVTTLAKIWLNLKSRKIIKIQLSQESQKIIQICPNLKKTILDKSDILVNLMVATNADTIEYLTTEAKVVFTCLGQAFTKIIIFQCFNSKYFIQFKTNASSYAISEILK